MQTIKLSRAFIAALACAAPAMASAHVVLADGTAAPGAYYTSFFRVGHGCAGSATTALRVEMPEGIVTARPQPKPGWTIAIERAPLSTPVKGENGKQITERVAAITWRGGPLPDDQWDQFGFMAKLPDHPGKLYFPAIQTCEQGEARWVETPSDPAAHLPHPAPSLTLAAGGMDDMAGMDMGGMAGMDMGSTSKPPRATKPPAATHSKVRRSVLHVSDAWIATPPNGAPTAAGYLNIRNDADLGDVLLSVSSPAARTVSAHTMSMAGGVMRMRPMTEGLDVPAHGAASLSPSGGRHLMFEGLNRPFKQGDRIAATLHFKTAGDVPVTFQVKLLSGVGAAR